MATALGVSPAVKQGQEQRVDVIDKLVRTQNQAQADLPTAPEPTPDPADPLVQSLIADGELAEADIAAPLSEAIDVAQQPQIGDALTPDQAAQREEERIAPLSERVAPSNTATAKWEPLLAQQERAQNLLNTLDYESEGQRVASSFIPTGKLDALQDQTQEVQADTLQEPEDGKTNFTETFTAVEAGTPVARKEGGGKFQVDPLFAWVATAATERFFAEGKQDLKQDRQADLLDFESKEEAVELQEADEDLKVARATGNERLGRQVWEEWQREQATRDGVPSDEYLLTKKAPSRSQLEYLGGTLKETYAASNPDMVERPLGKKDDPVYFQPTEKFLDQYQQFKDAADDPFDVANEVPPLRIAPEGKKAQPEFEAKLRTRPEVTKIASQVDPKALDQMNEARTNISRMGYKLDTRASSMVFSLGAPALAEARNLADSIGVDEKTRDDPFIYSDYWSIGKLDEFYAKLGVDKSTAANAKYMNIGVERLFSIMGDKRRLLAELTQARTKLEALQQGGANDFDIGVAQADVAKAERDFNGFRPVKIYNQELIKFAGELDALQRYGNQLNHFTFSIQMLTGRMHIQQNKLNPQSKKVQRFAMRQADAPVLVRPKRGGPVEQNFKEVVSVMLLDGKSLHKDARIQNFHDADLAGLIEIGNELTQLFEGADVTQQQQAFANKDIAALQQAPPVTFSDKARNELDKHKIEEAPYVMELLMDLAKWDRAYRTNTKFHTTFEAEMDGISHGVTSNGAALGVENTMIRGGVYHTDNVQKQVAAGSDVVGDLTKEMADVMTTGGRSIVNKFAPEGDRETFLGVLKLATNDRANFLKKAPMTFVYGQELKNLRQHVKSTLYTGDQASAIDPLLQSGIDPEQVENFLLQVMQNSLIDLLSLEAVQVSRQLRANNVLATLTGIPLHYDNAMGFRNWIGNRAQSDTFDSPLRFKDTEGTTPGTADIQHFRDEIHGAAPRKRGESTQAGGWGHGRIIPSVVQSYDGNMIAQTSTGQSFENARRKSQGRGHKYGYLPIFDAFKTNLANLDLVREEANANWWKGIQDKNFVEEIMGPDGWTKDVFAFLRELDQKNEPVNVFDGQFRGIGSLLQDEKQMQNLVASTFPFSSKEQLTNQEKIKSFSEGVVKNIYRELEETHGIHVGNLDSDTNPTLPPGDVVQIIRTVTKHIKLYDTNATLTNSIRDKRKKAFAKVKAQTTPLSQIDIG